MQKEIIFKELINLSQLCYKNLLTFERSLQRLATRDKSSKLLLVCGIYCLGGTTKRIHRLCGLL